MPSAWDTICISNCLKSMISLPKKSYNQMVHKYKELPFTQVKHVNCLVLK